jgi:hypothetical protein
VPVLHCNLHLGRDAHYHAVHATTLIRPSEPRGRLWSLCERPQLLNSPLLLQLVRHELLLLLVMLLVMVQQQW